MYILTCIARSANACTSAIRYISFKIRNILIPSFPLWEKGKARLNQVYKVMALLRYGVEL